MIPKLPLTTLLTGAVLILVITACGASPQASNTPPTSTTGPVLLATNTNIPTLQATNPPVIVTPTPELVPTQELSPTPSQTLPSGETPQVPPDNPLRSVILVLPGVRLPVYQEASPDSPVLTSFSAQAKGLVTTGNEVLQGEKTWLEITTADGQSGWVDAFHLTEDVPVSEFCADQRIPALLESLAGALTDRDGAALQKIISPVHGLTIRYFHTGFPANYTPDEAGWVFKSTFVNNWGNHPASDMEVKGTFSAQVLPDLLDVFENNYELYCMEAKTGPINYKAAWPFEYANINYYSVYKPGSPGIDLDWRTWIAGIEYVEGVPYIFSLHQFFWEP